ncbi:MAG TPA: MerR family transcriptional regulator [Terriglobales bacterium]|jgi:MerR family mercuric resistance operon transcriptional regulator|nr:MerR family transcriptional regulator [Terriglobales bacterium]
MKRRTIGELAREAGVGVETIRFYERRGILKQPSSPAQGWREYGDDALSTLRYIKQGQHLGFRLAEMKRLQERAGGEQQAFCESVRAATRERIWAVEEQIKQLRRMRRELQDFLGRCSAKNAGERCPIYESLGAMKRKKP